VPCGFRVQEQARQYARAKWAQEEIGKHARNVSQRETNVSFLESFVSYLGSKDMRCHASALEIARSAGTFVEMVEMVERVKGIEPSS
jgi:hypothetical protein